MLDRLGDVDFARSASHGEDGREILGNLGTALGPQVAQFTAVRLLGRYSVFGFFFFVGGERA